jgi:hypothetical protein
MNALQLLIRAISVQFPHVYSLTFMAVFSYGDHTIHFRTDGAGPATDVRGVVLGLG